MDNPFIDYNVGKNPLGVTIPAFKKTNSITIRISDEAKQSIQNMFSEKSLSYIIEAVGLGALSIIPAPLETDVESGVTTEDCRQAGFDDGVEGNLPRFLHIFGKLSDSVFERAYLRGFFEGNYMRFSDKGK